MVKSRTGKDKIEIEPPRLLTDLLGLVKEGISGEDPKKEARGYARSRFERENPVCT